uniref:PPM-type phosphatase domain-containing protein n=1 Tax=Kalanchoe fedtschenkoi TaxID=63787 RepID=A0A7N0UZ24_KALFE
MGGNFSQLCPCFHPSATNRALGANDGHHHNQRQLPDVLFTSSEPLDETLGHSFCYVRSSARFLSPTPSDRFLSPTHSLRFSPPHHDGSNKSRAGPPETGFRVISGASVSANSFTPRTVLQLDVDEDGGVDGVGVDSSGLCKNGSVVNGMFESTSSFSALPLQPNVSRTGEAVTGEGGFFMSGPIERGALSGPLDGSLSTAGSDQVPFSAPLGGMYAKKKRRKGISGFRKKFYKNIPERKQPWVVPVFNFVGKKEVPAMGDRMEAELRNNEESDVQWAHGKAGEDRVHVVVSEEHGWLFVGIYDGFNGPDAPEFLMANFYRAMYNELQGLFWEVEEISPNVSSENAEIVEDKSVRPSVVQGAMKKVTFLTEQTDSRRRRLWEFLAEDDPDDGLDLSGSERFAFSVDDAISVNKAGSAVNRRWLLLSKLRLGLLSNSKHKEGHGKKVLFPWKFGLENNKNKEDIEDKVEEERPPRSGKRRKVGPVDHGLVLNAMSRALDMTEAAYLDMTDKFLDQNPELALMGSCLLVVLMRNEDVYVMNVGDSRAIVAQSEQQEEIGTSTDLEGHAENGLHVEGIVEEPTKTLSERINKMVQKNSVHITKLTALQLSTDHSTSIEEEVLRIKSEHPDDSQCILNDRVKGRLKVTRAFGAGFLKQPKWNDPLLEIFRNNYIGTAPYVSCTPSLCHHKLCPKDQFLVLSSDGLYQYLSNQEVVSHIESFMEKSPEGDPAQHLIEELLSRAAKKAGMDLHELLDIPQGDRRKYHDDVTVMVVSLEGRIWKSSGKYF